MLPTFNLVGSTSVNNDYDTTAQIFRNIKGINGDDLVLGENKSRVMFHRNLASNV